MKQGRVARAVETKADGTVEIFEVFSEKLGKTIRVAITHPRDETLLSDRGLVMMAPPPDHAP